METILKRLNGQLKKRERQKNKILKMALKHPSNEMIQQAKAWLVG